MRKLKTWNFAEQKLHADIVILFSKSVYRNGRNRIVSRKMIYYLKLQKYIDKLSLAQHTE